jgi:hypothetical protein
MRDQMQVILKRADGWCESVNRVASSAQEWLMKVMTGTPDIAKELAIYIAIWVAPREN